MELFIHSIKVGLLVAAIVLVVLTFSYRYAPFKSHRVPKPSVVLLPKYVATFDCSPELIRQSLLSLKFAPDPTDSNTFNRGKVYGDFSVNVAKIRVEIDSSLNTIRLYAP